MRIGKDCAFHLLNVILFGLPNRGASLTNPQYNINTSVAAKPRWSTFGSARTFWTGVYTGCGKSYFSANYQTRVQAIGSPQLPITEIPYSTLSIY